MRIFSTIRYEDLSTSTISIIERAIQSKKKIFLLEFVVYIIFYLLILISNLFMVINISGKVNLARISLFISILLCFF